jgi:hypothetical protein
VGAELDDMKKTTPRGPQEPFVMLPRDLLRSDAWRSLGINERRVIDFLLLEHMSKGGRENGKLKAPWLQLVEFGAARNFITAAIRNLEDRGLVDCQRGGRRTMTLYTVNWLPMPDGSMPTMSWHAFRDPTLRALSTPKVRNSVPKEGQAMSPKRDKLRESVPKEGQKGPFSAQTDVPKEGVLSISRSNHAATDSIGECGNPEAADAAQPARRAAGGGE